jgi:hypothetical protein
MVSPWLFGFAAGGAETWLPVVLGAATIIYSVFTDYELGLVRKIPMPVHLALDLLSGALLAVSPWLFAFSRWVWAPHLIIGLFEIGVSLFTRTAPAVAHGTARRGVTRFDLR